MRRPLTLALLLAASVPGPASVAQNSQTPVSGSPATGLLMGVIVDAVDGRPVANAQVTLGGVSATISAMEVLTDAGGRFVFLDLPKGTYTITATKPGYADGACGRRRPLGMSQSLVLGEAERLGDLRIPIWKHAVITGRVVDEAGEPMVGMAVRVLQRSVVAGKRKLTPGATARTDDRGIYRIGSLTPGDYAVVVPSTQATAPESVVDLYFNYILQRASSSAPGTSDPLRDFSFNGLVTGVNLFNRHRGSRIGTLAFMATGGGVRAGIGPMTSGDGRTYVYPTLFYPAAATSSEASLITVRSGEERAGVDLQLKLVPTSRVSGTVAGPDGPLLAVLSLVPESDDLSTEAGFETATTVSDPSGRFTFLGVPMGRHQLRASWIQVPVGGGSRGAPPPTPPGAPPPAPKPLPALGGFTLWATQTISVGTNDVSDLSITMTAGYRISGRAEFIGSTPQPAPDAVRRMTVTIDPTDARPFVSSTIGRGQFDDNGILSTYQLTPGRYYLRVPIPPAGWFLKSATVGGRDITNVPLMLDRDVSGVVITFTDRPSTLSGQVSGAAGAMDAAATVLVFPADAGSWSDHGGFPQRLRAIRVDRTGQYHTAGLPGGDYLVVAIADESSANWQDPIVLKALSRLATPLTIADGESRSLPLKTTAVAR